MKGFIAFLLVAIVFCIGITPALARSGCCSYHGGVLANGCGCNDGSPLSSTCAPYYTCTYSAPVQQNTPTPIPPTATPYPTNTPTPTLTPTPTPKITQKPNIKPVVKSKPKPKANNVKPTPQKHWWDFLFGK